MERRADELPLPDHDRLIVIGVEDFDVLTFFEDSRRPDEDKVKLASLGSSLEAVNLPPPGVS